MGSDDILLVSYTAMHQLTLLHGDAFLVPILKNIHNRFRASEATLFPDVGGRIQMESSGPRSKRHVKLPYGQEFLAGGMQSP